MIVLIVFYRLQQALSVKLQLCLQVLNYFLIEQIRSLDDLELFSIFCQNI
jgi:hypothetical protein